MLMLLEIDFELKYTNTMESSYYNLGLAIGAAAHGVSTEEVMFKKASVDHIEDHRQTSYGSVQRLICKYAAEAYKESGQMEKFAYHVFDKLAVARPWWPEYDDYYSAAMQAIGSVHTTIRKEAAEVHQDDVLKSAGVITNVAGGVGKVTPGVLKSMLAGGAVAGVLGGSLGWLANRGVQQDEPKLEAMKNRINYYNQLTEEIESELANRGTPATPEEVEDIVNDII